MDNLVHLKTQTRDVWINVDAIIQIERWRSTGEYRVSYAGTGNSVDLDEELYAQLLPYLMARKAQKQISQVMG